MGEILWRPDPGRVAATRLARFTAEHGFSDYDELWRWSITDPAAFWREMWNEGTVIASGSPGEALRSTAMPGAEWFPDTRINYAENLLHRDDEGIAVVVADESGRSTEISWSALGELVARAQAGLTELGVKPGDRVAGLVTNGLEALVAMLATTATGAVWSSCSPDFGPTGVIDRFGQIDPVVLVTVDGYRYNGKTYPIGETVTAAVAAMPRLKAVVTIDQIGAPAHLDGTLVRTWDDLVAAGPNRPHFARMPFDHPLFIMFSSGTTGPPKSIVHGAGGTLLKHLSEHLLHSDVRRDDRVFWFTTCGWMMWNWLVGALASEAAVVLYDGSPSHPNLESLWNLAGSVGISHFGASPRFLAATADAGIEPRHVTDLSRMRWLGSTGAPLNPEQFDWAYAHVGDDLQLASISGGTDIIGCFAMGVPTEPVRRGELQRRALGMAVEAWDENRNPVIGQKGELVCTEPFPSMPVGFWSDPTGDAYHQAYFAANPGVWTHGDFIEIRPEGGVVIHGRSDTTLNPGGVRIGTAEIYRAVETMPEIDDCIAVGLDRDGDVDVALFVVPTADVVLDVQLEAAIRTRIRTETSPRHVPSHIRAVPEVPYTLSGKKVEKAVQIVVSGGTVDNRDALANPAALDAYIGLI